MSMTKAQIEKRINDDLDVKNYLVDQENIFHKPEPAYCKKFGCGRELTCHERLFGNFCSEHSIKKQEVDLTHLLNF
jgi:hypothetical protein